MPKAKTRKTVVARYKATLSLDNVGLAKAKSAVTLNVFDRGEKLGELQIGRGSVFWWGANRKNGKRIWWGQLAAILNEHAYGEK